MRRFFALMLLLAPVLYACAPEQSPPAAPLALNLPVNADGIPLLNVYVLEEKAVRAMDLESYLCGVVAGEMRSDWPPEALRAQAILARTFVLRFVTEKESIYPGADISTDVLEAQAYDADAVNDAIREAVSSTAGLALLAPDGSLPYTWFHAHSGGKTALAREGLDWQGEEPSHTRVADGLDSPDAPDSAREWSAAFNKEVFLTACRACGAQPDGVDEIRIMKKGGSGRAVTLMVDGFEINAARLRIALGSTAMRSTLLTELASDGETVFMAGRGYGHGVGMPQWGAYALAQDGFSGEEIALHYYNGLTLVSLWPRPGAH